MKIVRTAVGGMIVDYVDTAPGELIESFNRAVDQMGKFCPATGEPIPIEEWLHSIVRSVDMDDPDHQMAIDAISRMAGLSYVDALDVYPLARTDQDQNPGVMAVQPLMLNPDVQEEPVVQGYGVFFHRTPPEGENIWNAEMRFCAGVRLEMIAHCESVEHAQLVAQALSGRYVVPVRDHSTLARSESEPESLPHP